MIKYFYYREHIRGFVREIANPSTVVFTYLRYSEAGLLLDIKTGYDIDFGDHSYRVVLDANQAKELITVDKWEI